MVQIAIFVAAVAAIAPVLAAPVAGHITPDLAVRAGLNLHLQHNSFCLQFSSREPQVYKRALAFYNDFIELERRQNDHPYYIDCKNNCKRMHTGAINFKRTMCINRCKVSVLFFQSGIQLVNRVYFSMIINP